MFTVEIDGEETSITILDSTGDLEDINVLLYDDYCFIRQWNEERKTFDLVAFKAEMYLALMEAWNLPQGAYTIEKKDN
jgi:hypothetical protein